MFVSARCQGDKRGQALTSVLDKLSLHKPQHNHPPPYKFTTQKREITSRGGIVVILPLRGMIVDGRRRKIPSKGSVVGMRHSCQFIRHLPPGRLQ